MSMNEYKVWQPSGMSEQHAGDVVAACEVEAAETWAERNWEREDGDKLDLRVRAPDGRIHEVEVIVDFEPSFNGLRRSAT